MKKILPYLLCFSLLSCDKLFHEEELSVAEITSVEELESAINGAYAQFSRLFTSTDVDYIFFNVNAKGDDLSSNPFPNYYYYYNYDVDCEYFTDDRLIQGPWKELYTIIASVNNIIEQFYPPEEQGQQEKQLLGEVYFLRAYCYFRLTRTFGKITLIKDIDIDYSTPLAGYGEVYTFIENDLKTAIQLLPRNNNEARIPYYTVHRGTARAFLAEVYLSWGGYPVKDNSKYALAAQTAGEVIDSAVYFGFGLEQDFARVWEEDNRYNPETILALYFLTPDSTSSFPLSISPGVNILYLGDNVIPFKTFQIEADSSWIGIRFFSTEINFYNNYPNNYRKEITFFTKVYVPGYRVRDNPELDSMYVEVAAGPCARPAYRKFFYTSSVNILSYEWCMNTPQKERFHGNPKIYLYRYAQLLLTYAEAMARSGQLNNDAYEAVNQIRRRAYHTDIHTASLYDIPAGLSAEAFADSVVQERAWELAGEIEGRWFDLVRLERVEELEHTRHPMEGGFPEDAVTKEDYFLSIPGEDQLLNPSLEE